MATTVVVDGAPDDGGAAGAVDGADAAGAPPTEAPPLLIGSCIVFDVAAVPPGSEPLPTLALFGGSSPFPALCVFSSSARILDTTSSSSSFFRLRASASLSGVSDGAFEDVSTADSFSIVLMGSLLINTH